VIKESPSFRKRECQLRQHSKRTTYEFFEKKLVQTGWKLIS
jgi:hypothetical protein